MYYRSIGLLLLFVLLSADCLPADSAFNFFRLPCTNGPKRPPKNVNKLVCDTGNSEGVVCGVMLTSLFEVMTGKSVDVQFLNGEQTAAFAKNNLETVKEVCSFLLSSDTASKSCCKQLTLLCSNVPDSPDRPDRSGSSRPDDRESSTPFDIFDMFGFRGDGRDGDDIRPDSHPKITVTGSGSDGDPQESEDLWAFMKNVFNMRHINQLFSGIVDDDH